MERGLINLIDGLAKPYFDAIFSQGLLSTLYILFASIRLVHVLAWDLPVLAWGGKSRAKMCRALA